MNCKEFYENVGGSYDALMSRVSTEERIKKYLMLFKSDTSMSQLKTAIEGKDFVEAFHAVHTLKGISANLALDDFYNACCELTEVFRHYNGEPYEKEYKKVQEKYEYLISQIDLIK